MLSHGSSGPGESENRVAKFFLSHGFSVGIIDYFTAHGITSLGWIDHGPCIDQYTATFKDIFDIDFPDHKKIVHIGFSLGGFVGLMHSNKFIKNYCFYPGIIALTDQLLEQDYSNTTVIIPSNDTWCDNFYSFYNMCKTPPVIEIAQDAFHGFMLPNKDREILITKYNTTERILSIDDFENLQFNCEKLKSVFPDSVNQIIKLQSHTEYSIMYLDKILSEIEYL